jgi:outer membrane receptor protein involved in Fe transport
MSKRDRLTSPIPRFSLTAATVAICALLPASAAYADGQVRFVVVDAKTRRPLATAKLFLDPDESELEGLQFDADTQGVIETGDQISGTRSFRVRATEGGIVYKEYRGKITILEGQTVEVEIPLEEQGFIDLTIQERVQRLDITNTSQSTFRDRKFFDLFPIGIGNRQSVSKLLRAVPGFVGDSVLRTHARGEQGGTLFVVDGFQLPQWAVGSATPFLVPEAYDTYLVRTGGYSPEFGGVSGAVVDLTMRPGVRPSGDPLRPFVEFRVGDTGYNGAEQYLTFGRQGGNLGVGGDPRVGYFFSLSQRYTNNALETPIQGNVRNNASVSGSFAGKADYQLTDASRLSVLFNQNSGRTGIANTGPQAQRGADAYQKDNNRFYVLQYRMGLNTNTQATVGLGYVRSTQFLLNNTPGADQNLLPATSAVDFKQTAEGDYEQTQVQADVTLLRAGGRHTIKLGTLAQYIGGKEAYQYIPQSTAALGLLGGFDSVLGQRLLPQRQANGTFVSPVLRIDRDGTYSAFYAQDTWAVQDTFRINLGLRSESYDLTQSRSLVPGSGRTKSSSVSPRLNIVYQLPERFGVHFLRRRLATLKSSQPTLLRASYNRLFTQPDLNQGNLGTFPLAPQFTDQYDLSLERQFRRQSVKAGLYSKEIQNQIGYEAIIPLSPATGYRAVNLGRASSRGFELSYEYNPRDFSPAPGDLREYRGIAGFLVYSQGQSRHYGNRSTQGFPIFINPQDQNRTLTAGVGYRFVNGTSLGLSHYYGSGLFASALNGGRDTISETNLRLTTPTNFFNRSFGLEFAVENVFGQQNRYNAGSAFAGTRFQQGRRILISALGKF